MRAFRIIAIVSLWLLSCASLEAATVTLAWDLPTRNMDGTPLTDLSSIDVFYGVKSGEYAQRVNAGLVTSMTFSGLTGGLTYYFAATAVNRAGQSSPYSNEAYVAVMPAEEISTPTVRLITPKHGASVKRRGRVPLTAEVVHTRTMARVEFWVDTNLTCLVQSATVHGTSYTCPWHVPTPKGRRYTVQAKAIDAAGNLGSSQVVEVVAQ